MRGFETEELRQRQIKGLLRERETAKQAGRDDVVKAATKSLKEFGYHDPDAETVEEKPKKVRKPAKAEASAEQG